MPAIGRGLLCRWEGGTEECGGVTGRGTTEMLRLRGGFDVAAAQADYVREVMEVMHA